MRRALAFFLLASAGGCSGDEGGGSAEPEPEPPDTTRECQGDTALQTCTDGECERRECRGDELCTDGACVPWFEAPLRADFELSFDAEHPRLARVQVVPGGFPRQHVEALRFDFGDGSAGWGEDLTHEYAEPGVYAIDLEVRLEGLRWLRASRPAVARDDDGFPPPSRALLTVNRIPEHLNGSVPFTADGGTPGVPGDDVEEPFHLLLPPAGFSIDVTLLDAPGSELDRESMRLTADVELDGGSLPPGANLIERLEFSSGETERVVRGRWVPSPDEAFPRGELDLGLVAEDAFGDRHVELLPLEVEPLPPERDPFDRPMTWLLRFDMDRFHANAREGAVGTLLLESFRGRNGEADFAEELRLLGGASEDDALGAAEVEGRGAVGASAIFRRWVIERVVRETHRYFHVAPGGTPQTGIDLRIVTDHDPQAPDPSDFTEEGEFSMMRLGGSFEEHLGFSRFSPHNELRVDDSSDDLGVATASILGTLVATPLLAEVVDAIRPGKGAPVGTDELDAVVLAGDFDRYEPGNAPEANERYDELAQIARFMGLAIGAVTAHEMGHAMGLVPNGAPPVGFFGDRPDVTFMGSLRTNSHHADYPGLNLMQAGGNVAELLATAFNRIERPADTSVLGLVLILALENRLSPYSFAYLNRQLTYRDFGGRGG